MAVPQRLWKKLGAVDGFLEGASIFGQTEDDRAYFVDGTQVANEHHGDMELRLTKSVIRRERDRLRDDPRVELRGSSDWVTVRTTNPKDDAFVLELAALAAAAHRPTDGRAIKPPPEGRDLARRRRFH